MTHPFSFILHPFKKSPWLFFSFVLVLLISTGCQAKYQIRRNFTGNFAAKFHPSVVECLGMEEYQNTQGERRFRAIGAMKIDDSKEWSLIWADYGEWEHQRWIPLEYPATPIDTARTRAEAKAKANEYLRQFRENSQEQSSNDS